VLTDFGEIVSMEKQPFWQLFQFQIGPIAKKQIYSVELSQTGLNSKKASSLVDGNIVASRIQLPKQSASRFYKQSYLT
jgi:hypothetical protein